MVVDLPRWSMDRRLNLDKNTNVSWYFFISKMEELYVEKYPHFMFINYLTGGRS